MQLTKPQFYLVIGFLFTSHCQMWATIIGSDFNTQAAQPHFTFQQGQSNNRLANYAWTPNGFSLADAFTSAIFDSTFPVSGLIQLNGGTLILNRDLIFNNTTTLKSLGTIIGQGHILSLPQNVASLPSSTRTFQDTKIYLNNNLALSSSITFTGSCFIEGNGHQLILGSNAELKVGNNSTLVLHNVILNRIRGTNVRCLNDTALLILDNSSWIQSDDTTFLVGALQFRNNVIMAGNSRFSYQTLKTSLVTSQANLLLDHGFTFSYDPVRLASKTLLQFSDSSSSLVLNSATIHANAVGLNLTRGSLIIKGSSTLASEIKTIGSSVIDQGITLGDGLSAISDCSTIITPGARLNISQGSLNYNNTLSNSWIMENNAASLNMGKSTTLRLYKTLNLGLGVALCDELVKVARVPVAQLLGSVSAIGDLFFVQL